MTQDAEGDRAERRALLLLLVVLGLVYVRDMFWTLPSWSYFLSSVEYLLIRPVLLMIQVIHSLPRFARFTARYRFWTLSVQALLTFAPAFLISDTAAVLPDFLAGSTLLLLRAPWSWLAYGLTVAGTVAAITRMHLDGHITVHAVFMITTGGLLVFGMSRLADAIVRLHRARRDLVRMAVARERLMMIEDLHERMTAQLAEIVRRSENAATLVASHLGRARSEATMIIVGAGRTLANAREAAARYRSTPSVGQVTAADRGDAEPRLARAIITAVLCLTIGYDVDYAITHRAGVANIVIAFAVAAASLVLQLRHSLPTGTGGPPRAWKWTLALQGVLVCAALYIQGVAWIGIVPFLGASMLFLVPSPWSWASLAVIIAGDVLLVGAMTSDTSLGVFTYYPAASLLFGLGVYGHARFARIAVELRDARAEVARMAQVRVRLRLSRDMHDVIGSSLSAVLIKAQLAVELLGDDRTGAERELREVADLARRTAREVEALSVTDSRVSLTEELSSARTLLTSAGVVSRVTAAPAGLPPELDHALAMVVREAVTNVLRHSKPSLCSIEADTEPDLVRLRVTNDGATGPSGEGTGAGLGNLGDRLHDVGGRLGVEFSGETFELSAEVPLRKPAASLP
ncbi:histidine kinase [Nonomuraea sp. NEAU-A123]|uniref:sensor histidine kinase n=1 Tax=Nonomuraea sp. NEAU-A123 TaxID=2839649 RepID=UPI001BE45184|nr:histidine kinase [Nonomuraea sp. NEAU-A123]MBT2228368.1 hypothetical protein [Nonomuraea sp. NEAU-A123]